MTHALNSIERPSGLIEYPVQPFKDKEFSIKFLQTMIRTRVLEERMIKMSKMSEGFFWIGGPGEEAFNTALGLLVDKGEGLEHDMLHLHYRNNGAVLTMGAPMIDFIRQMKNVSQDPFSGGRNFVSHIAKKEWNVMPVTSTIETQYSVAPGTAWAQRRAKLAGKKTGISIVVGGDAGTAEGDFASCLIWSSRPEQEVPLLMIVTNNQFGISTPAQTQHGEKNIADRAKAFGIKTSVVDGNNPEKIWAALQSSMDYVRSTGKPFLLEVSVSRLNGHSSSSGGNREKGFDDPIDLFEKRLAKLGWISKDFLQECTDAAWAEANLALDNARKESLPEASTVQDHFFANNERGGIPGRNF